MAETPVGNNRLLLFIYLHFLYRPPNATKTKKTVLKVKAAALGSAAKKSTTDSFESSPAFLTTVAK